LGVAASPVVIGSVSVLAAKAIVERASSHRWSRNFLKPPGKRTHEEITKDIPATRSSEERQAEKRRKTITGIFYDEINLKDT
jgi:hypothetical protein